MHIPDGFLSVSVCLAAGAASAAAVTFAARCAQRESDESRAPLLGVMGAFVFAAQMINFPVGVGTTGHLVGAALLAFTIGPSSAAVVMTAILAIQALVFQDGGVLALGANVFNMAVAGVLAGYVPYRLMAGGPLRRASMFLGGACSVMVSAVLALAELRLSGVAMPRAVFSFSLLLFAVNAILEGLLTVGVVQALESLDRRWVLRPPRLGRTAVGVMALSALLLASIGILFSSGNPDGIASLLGHLGLSVGKTNIFAAPLANYQSPFAAGAWMAKTIAGLAGLMLVGGAAFWIGRARGRRGSG